MLDDTAILTIIKDPLYEYIRNFMYRRRILRAINGILVNMKETMKLFIVLTEQPSYIKGSNTTFANCLKIRLSFWDAIIQNSYI